MPYAAVTRHTLHFNQLGWSASYRLHFGWPASPSPGELVRASDWAAQLDIPNFYFGDALGAIRSSASRFTDVESYVVGSPPTLRHVLLISDAVQNGGDDTLPVLSAGQAVQVELVTGEPGRGVNGRLYLPYWGGNAYDHGATDHVNPEVLDICIAVLDSYAFYTPSFIPAELVVCKRQMHYSPVSPLDSSKVKSFVFRSSTFQHQRRRVQYERRMALPV